MALIACVGISASNLIGISTAYAKRVTFSGETVTSYTYDNNIYRTSSNKVSDALMTLTQTVNASMNPKGYGINTNYRLNYARFFTRTSQNSMEHSFVVSGSSGERNNWVVKPSYNYVFSQDVRGEVGSTTGPGETPDTWSQKGYGMKVQYQSPNEDFSSSVLLNINEKKYDSAQLKSRDSEATNLTFSHRVMMSGKTSIKGSVALTKSEALHSSESFGKSYGLRYSLGTQWKSSGKTSSQINFGTMSSATELGDLSLFGDLFVAMNVSWHHRYNSIFSLNFGRQFVFSPVATNGQYISNSGSIGWRRKIGRRISTNMIYSGNYVERNGDNIGESINTGLKLGIRYDMNRIVSLDSGFNYTKYIKLDGKEGDYTAAIYTLGINISI